MPNSRPNVSALPLLTAAGPVMPVISRNVLQEDMRPQTRPVIAVPLLLITAEPVTPAKTTPVRQDIANPPVAATITRPERPRLKPGQPVMPVPRTATPAPADISLQAVRHLRFRPVQPQKSAPAVQPLAPATSAEPKHAPNRARKNATVPASALPNAAAGVPADRNAITEPA